MKISSINNNGALVPNYSYIFHFEQEFEHSDVKDWMEQNWSRVCLLASSVYMIIIFGGQYIMSARERFEMQNVLTFWNIFLALFSLMGFSRTLPELFHVLFSSRGDGLYHSLCIPSFIEKDRVSGFWSLMFVISKVPELGDTLFIILRKQRLIFLHWYHHVTVLLYSWYSYSEYTAVARWFIVMNYLVHSLMYSYYTFKTLKINMEIGRKKTRKPFFMGQHISFFHQMANGNLFRIISCTSSNLDDHHILAISTNDIWLYNKYFDISN
nr:elongation of very long chain fatty acids protein 6-like isoform X1 [Lepeophtheirus salmonis]